MRRKDSFSEIHKQQDKDNCWLDKGDLIKIRLKNGEEYVGELLSIDLRLQTDTELPDGQQEHLYTSIDISLPKDENGHSDVAMFFVNDISHVEVLRLGKEGEQ